MPKKLNKAFTSFNYFDGLFQNTKQNTVILMDKEGIITEINTAFTEAFGYTDKEIIGKHTKILFTEEDQKQGLPERELKTVLETGESKDNNYLVHQNKTVTWVKGESLLIKNDKGEISILKLIQNIHDQKTYENLLQQSNEFNESILRSIEDIVIVLDSKMKLLKANKAFREIFADVHGTENLDFKDIIKPYDAKDELQNKIQSTIITRAGFLNKEIEIETGEGNRRVYAVSCTPMEDNNNVLLVLHDITIQRYAERQREDIIGFVAHELRNPLANIVLCNELLEETLHERNLKDAADLLQRSKNNVMRLNKMIADLYDATKVGSGNMQLDIADFNFEEMVKEAIKTIEVLQPEYEIIKKGHADIIVRGDKYRLIQVLTNYLSNGIKYSKGTNKVELAVEHNKNGVTVAVKDKGLGISKDQLPYIFNRFFRAEKTKNLEGVGLGLYLCQQIIKAHEGKVWVESEEGKGSTFYFSIPIKN